MKTRGLHIAINSQGRAPEWVHLVPAGQFVGRDGRGPWRLADPEGFIEATMDYQAGADLPLDYEHQSLMSEQNGRPAPAAGWIKELAARADGIWGRVEWTERGAEMVAGREYRYISPVIVHEENGDLVRLDSAALVAQPNLELKALNKQTMQGATMEEFLRQLAALLGLGEAASQEEIFTAVKGLTEGGESANAEGEGEGGAGDETPPETLPEAEAALMDAVSDLLAVAEEEAGATANKKAGAATAANAAFKAMHAMGKRLAALEGDVARNRAEKVVDKAVAAGRVTPGMRPWAMNYATSDPAGFAKYIQSAPVIVAPGRADEGKVPNSAGGLSDEERAVCKQLGLDEAEYLKSRGVN